MLRLSKSRSYAVPIIQRALDILELLYERESPLKTNEIADIAQIPRSTTYRILRTFLERGYIYQNLDGQFGVRDSKLMKALPIERSSITTSLNHAVECESNLSADRVVEILLAVLQGLKRGSADQLKQRCE
jgi:DNA-binding MarR family transcriptional regulator